MHVRVCVLEWVLVSERALGMLREPQCHPLPIPRCHQDGFFFCAITLNFLFDKSMFRVTTRDSKKNLRILYTHPQIIEISYLGTRELRNKHHGKGMAQALLDESQKLI